MQQRGGAAAEAYFRVCRQQYSGAAARCPHYVVIAASRGKV